MYTYHTYISISSDRIRLRSCIHICLYTPHTHLYQLSIDTNKTIEIDIHTHTHTDRRTDRQFNSI